MLVLKKRDFYVNVIVESDRHRVSVETYNERANGNRAKGMNTVPSRWGADALSHW